MSNHTTRKEAIEVMAVAMIDAQKERTYVMATAEAALDALLPYLETDELDNLVVSQ